MKEEEKNMPEIIYHYTNWVVFEKILRNKSLRLGDLQSMNDYKESMHYLDIFESKICSRLMDEFPNKVGKAKRFIRQVREDIYKERAYSLCFSKLKDDAAQWERYGHVGQGVCLGIKTEELSRQIKERSGFCRIQPVFYLESLHEHQHLDIFYNFLIHEESGEFGCLGDWQANLHATASAFKHESFASEKEVRLVSLPVADRFKRWLDNETVKLIYEAKEDRIRSFIEITFPRLEECIVEITIGPRSSQDKDELTEILKKWNFEALAHRDCISVSKCPLR